MVDKKTAVPIKKTAVPVKESTVQALMRTVPVKETTVPLHKFSSPREVEREESARKAYRKELARKVHPNKKPNILIWMKVKENLKGISCIIIQLFDDKKNCMGLIDVL